MSSIKGALADLLRRTAPGFVTRAVQRLDAVLDPYATRSYSQEGEDLLLRRLLEGLASGIYVDVGAHHPQRFSNTWWFYQRGWHGINIEPNPDAVDLFRRARPRDITVQAGVSDQPGMRDYFQFSDAALNTFDGQVARDREAGGIYTIRSTITVPMRTLTDILSEHLEPKAVIAFLSVDVEGFDLQVLRSNDWQRFRPALVLTEVLDTSLAQSPDAPVHTLMQTKGFQLMAKTLNTLIYRDATRGK